MREFGPFIGLAIVAIAILASLTLGYRVSARHPVRDEVVSTSDTLGRTSDSRIVSLCNPTHRNRYALVEVTPRGKSHIKCIGTLAHVREQVR